MATLTGPGKIYITSMSFSKVAIRPLFRPLFFDLFSFCFLSISLSPSDSYFSLFLSFPFSHSFFVRASRVALWIFSRSFAHTPLCLAACLCVILCFAIPVFLCASRSCVACARVSGTARSRPASPTAKPTTTPRPPARPSSNTTKQQQPPFLGGRGVRRNEGEAKRARGPGGARNRDGARTQQEADSRARSRSARLSSFFRKLPKWPNAPLARSIRERPAGRTERAVVGGGSWCALFLLKLLMGAAAPRADSLTLT